jgi:hypothetical protein
MIFTSFSLCSLWENQGEGETYRDNSFAFAAGTPLSDGKGLTLCPA